MKNFLRSKQYWSLIKSEKGSDQWSIANRGTMQIDWRTKAKGLECKNYLFQVISYDVLESIFNEDTLKGIRDSMKHKFQSSSSVKRVQLQVLHIDFFILHMKERETVNAFFCPTLTIANKMKACDKSVSEITITKKILISIVSNSKINHVVCLVEESSNLYDDN